MAIIARTQFTVSDLSDPIISAAAPIAPVVDMLWLDTGVTPNQLKRWDGAAWSVVNDVVVGGRNLLLDSGVEVTNASYGIMAYVPSSPLVEKTEYTITICITPAAGVSSISPYVSNGHIDLGSLLVSGVDKQIVSATTGKTWAYAAGRTPEDGAVYANVVFYRFPNDGTVTGNSTIHWVKIEKGNIATDWSPAPEEVLQEINDLVVTTSQSSADIAVLKDRISSTVTQENYFTDMKQKADLASVNELVKSVLSQTADQINMKFGKAEEYTVNVDGRLQTALNELNTYINFSSSGIELGEHNNPFKTLISNTEISFMQDGHKVAYINNNKLYIKRLEVTQSIKTGGLQWDITSDGELLIDWVGGD